MTRPFAYRSALFLASSSAALLIAGAAAAQEAPADTTSIDDIVVTGSRVPSRSRLDTLAPVDVVTAETLATRGTTEFAAALAQTVPSLVFARPSVVDGTDSIRPATLRGLSPDQTLVLLNGTRRHASALVNVNGSIGRGSAAVDLNAIPTGALDRVEVLRDGASAWQGLGLGSDGFLTLSAEYLNREPTNRSDYDPRVTPNAITARAGDPKVEQWTAFANAGKPLNADWEAYGWAGYQHRDSESAAFPRLANNYTQNVAAIYPNGYLPKIAVNSQDLSLAGGVKGEIAGWSADFSLVYGRNALDFRTENSLNRTYGAQSLTSFDSGGLTYDQLVFGADFTRQFEVGLSGPLNFAWGLEARREGYKIDAGQPESWNRGPIGTGIDPVSNQPVTFAGGAQGFIGFQPSNEIDEDRDAVALYADVEIPLTEKFTVEGALRVEDYSDFGDAHTGKLAARYDFSPNFALRGSISTGFRAPSLQQSFFTSTSSVIQNGAVVETGTFPATSAVATTLGARALKPETSTNYSLGAVVRLGNFDLTVDAYKITIEDQIVLSELINRTFSTQVAGLLDPLGVQAARFFLNGVTTETEGVDIVGRYRLRTESAGNWDFTVAANVNDVSVTKLPTSSSVLNPVPTLFARSRILTIEEGTPDTKVSSSADWSLGRWGATARATYYADVLQPGSTAAADYSTGAKTTVDLEGRFQVTDRIGVAVGVDNVFDEYPDFVPANLNSNGVLGFPYYSPFGFNGRYGYARLSVKW